MRCIKSKNFITIKGDHFKVVLSNKSAAIYDIVFENKHMVINYLDKNKHLESNPYFFGKTVGRIGGRVVNGDLSFGGKTYKLKINEGKNSHHGGGGTIHTYVFSSEITEAIDKVVVEFKTKDLDGTNGYPGNAEIVVRYTISNEGSILIEFESLSDQDTPINLINHTYYNIDGELTILNQMIKANTSECYFSRNDTTVDTSRTINLEKYNLSKGVMLAELLEDKAFKEFHQIGIDHCFIFKGGNNCIQLMSKVHTLTLETDYPVFQMYSYNHLQQKKILLNTLHFDRYRAGIAIEPQEIPGDFDKMISKQNELKRRWMKLSFTRNKSTK